MMIRAAATDPFSLGDIAAILLGLVIVGGVVFYISTCAQDSPLISDFLHRTQSEADASRFEELLGALNGPHQGSHLPRNIEGKISHANQTKSEANALSPKVTPPKQQESGISDGGGGSDYRSEFQAIYDREIASGGLKSGHAVPTAGRRASL